MAASDRAAALVAAAAIVLVVPARALAQDAPEQQQHPLGGPGESCRARSDCRADLKCVHQTCTSERDGESCESSADCGGLKCVRNRCTSGAPKSEGRRDDRRDDRRVDDDDPDKRDGESWSTFKLEGVHPYVGLSWLGGPVLQGQSVNNNLTWARNVEGAGLTGIRGGIFAGRTQIGVEISPATYFYYRGIPGPAFQINGTFGPFLPLYEGSKAQIYWPIRIGAGLVAGNTIPKDTVYFQGVFELFGIAIKAGHMLIDLNLPSFRYALAPGSTFTGHAFSWLFGGSVSYVF